MLRKHYPEVKSSVKRHLCMQIFHKNKESRSRDQNKHDFNFVLLAMKAIINRPFFMISFRVSYKHPITTLAPENLKIINKIIKLLSVNPTK